MSSYLYSLYDTISIRNGRVGLGTTNPRELLDVNGGSAYIERITNTASNIDFSYSHLNNVQKLSLDTLSSLTTTNIDVNQKTLSNINSISVSTITSDASTIFFNGKSLSNIENVFVNNDLRIGQNLYASNLYVIGEFTTLDTLTSNTEQMTITNAGTGPALIVRQTGSENVAAFYDDNNTALVISDGSKVGINTSAPSQRLHVYDASASVFAQVQTASTNAAQMKLTNSDGDTTFGPTANSTVELKSTATNYPILIGANSQMTTMCLDTNGNVGVGTTAPTYKLDVAGATRITNSLYLNVGGMNLINSSYGSKSFTSSGAAYIGMKLAWTNVTTDNKLAFRAVVKCHLASDTSVAYRKFESIITPANDAGNGKPKQTVATEIADTNNDDFTMLTHTVTRSTSSAVDVVVSWNTALTSYIGNIQVEVFASESLGNFTFTSLSS